MSKRTLRFTHEVTQAYWAGVITATARNMFPCQSIPNVFYCYKNFTELNLVFPQIYSKMRINKRSRKLVAIYERFTFQPGQPVSRQGGEEEFFIGYSEVRVKKRMTQEDREFLESIGIVIKYFKPKS
jgi:hypothetical protein